VPNPTPARKAGRQVDLGGGLLFGLGGGARHQEQDERHGTG
jgi:hypothetical protein